MRTKTSEAAFGAPGTAAGTIRNGGARSPALSSGFIELARDALVQFGNREKGIIRCVSGTLWITCEGDLRDYVLADGQRFTVPAAGLTIVQALTRAAIELRRLKE